MAQRFWVGGLGTWDALTTTHWSATTGGTGGASVPTSTDAVIFDSNSGSGTVIISGNVPCASFVATGFPGTFTVTGSTISITGGAFTGAGHTYNNVTINAGGSIDTGNTFSGTLTLLGSITNGIPNNTYNNITITSTSGVPMTVLLAGPITVSGTFTITGNAAGRVTMTSSFAGTITVTSASNSFAYVDFRLVVGAGAASWNLSSITGRSGDYGNNSGIIFSSALTYYWFSNTGNFSDPTKWFTATNGGGSSSVVPIVQDTALFDANSFSTSGQTVTFDLPYICSVNFTGSVHSPAITVGTSTAFCGSITLISTITTSDTQWHMSPTGICTFTPAAANLSSTALTMTGVAGTLSTGVLSLAGDLTFATISVSTGTLDANGHNITCARLATTTSASHLTIGSGTWSISGTGTVTLSLNGGSIDFSGGGLIVLTDASGSARTVTGSTTNSIGNLNVTGSGTTTFTNVKCHNLDFTGFTGTWTGSTGGLNISGNLTLVSGMTRSYSGTITFSATNSVNITNAGKSLPAVIFNGIGGTWNLQDDLTCTSSLSLTNGTIAGAHTVACTSVIGSSGTSVTTAAISCSGGIAISSGTITLGTASCTTFSLTNAVVTLTGNLTCSSTFAVSTTLTGSFNGNGHNISCTTYTLTSNANVTVGSGSVTVTSTGTVIDTSAGTITFDGSSGTFIVSDTSATGKTLNLGGHTYNGLQISGAASNGAVTIASSNTIHTLTLQANASVIFTAGTTTTITSLTATGTSGNIITIQSTTSGTAAIITCASGILSGDYLSLKDSHATGSATFYAGANSTNVSGNTGWIFTAAPTIANVLGNVSTSAAGSLTATGTISITGLVSTSAVGTVTASVPVSVSPNVTGNVSTGTLGALLEAISSFILGNTSADSIGILTVTAVSNASVSGNVSTSAEGTINASASTNAEADPLGTVGASSIGTTITEVDSFPNGLSSTSTVGTTSLVITSSASIAGNETDSALGSLLTTLSTFLLGIATTSALGGLVGIGTASTGITGTETDSSLGSLLDLVSPTISSVITISSLGSLNTEIDLVIASNEADGSIGTVVAGSLEQVLITGTETDNSMGSLIVILSTNPTITGTEGDSAVGSILLQISVSPPGNTSTSHIGILSEVTTANIDVLGNQGTLSDGLVTINQAEILTGNSSTSTAGIPSSIGTALTTILGNSASTAVGTVLNAIQAFITGTTGISAIGALQAIAALILTGVQAIGSIGSLSWVTDYAVAITSVAVSGFVNSLRPSIATPILSNTATGYAGNLIINAIAKPIGCFSPVQMQNCITSVGSLLQGISALGVLGKLKIDGIYPSLPNRNGKRMHKVAAELRIWKVLPQKYFR